ncbi:hypothetical protein ACFVT5_40210 [Streptomyces sp. NPDC058001]|uniref:hypothetical protein n=1 Tax=Streptomyces sp. NPDC058001 TaxID=3346300 RepID=UPI0036F09D7C
MRSLYVPVRLAVVAAAVAATAGCMSVGDDAGRPGPSHSAGPRGGAAAPDGGTGATGGGTGHHDEHGAKADSRPGADGASPSASLSGTESPTASAPGKPPGDAKPDVPNKPDVPTPTHPDPTPPRNTPDPTPTKPDPEPSSPDPTTPEPSSSAHEDGPSGDQAARFMRMEPSPEAGEPV